MDLDGTITDSGKGITNSAAYALKHFGIEINDTSSLNFFVGPPLLYSFTKICGLTHDDGIKAIKYYRNYYREKGMFECNVYDGIPELLKYIHGSGKTLILCTSKPEFYAKQILDHFGLGIYFTGIAGATMDEKRSEKNEIIDHIFNEMGVYDKDRSVLIGDTKYDIVGANETGIDSIGVTYGYGTREELLGEHATYIYDSPSSILHDFKNNNTL